MPRLVCTLTFEKKGHATGPKTGRPHRGLYPDLIMCVFVESRGDELWSLDGGQNHDQTSLGKPGRSAHLMAL
jgi:hypothetical protein